MGVVPAGCREEKKLNGAFDLILFFAENKKQLDADWNRVTGCMKKEGLLWVAFPKKSSGIASDLGMMDGWEITKSSAWHGVSLISIDETWSGTRFRYHGDAPPPERHAADEDIFDHDGTLCVDRSNRKIFPSKDLASLLNKNKKAQTFFDSLSFSNKKEYVLWIVQAKRIETREERLKKITGRLLSGKKNPAEK